MPNANPSKFSHIILKQHPYPLTPQLTVYNPATAPKLH
jgi:hypothetical protein